MASAAGAVDELGDESWQEADTVLLAKAYFDVNEFLRAAHVLRDARSAQGLSIRWYSLFLAGEKRKDERMLEESGGGSIAVLTGKPRAINEQLALLQTELQAEDAAGRLDGFGQYVYGLTLRELQRRTDAAAAFRQAAILCPCFWSAWLELAAALPDADAVNSLDLPNHWMSSFFRAHAALEAQRNSDKYVRGVTHRFAGLTLLAVPARPREIQSEGGEPCPCQIELNPSFTKPRPRWFV